MTLILLFALSILVLILFVLAYNNVIYKKEMEVEISYLKYCVDLLSVSSYQLIGTQNGR